MKRLSLAIILACCTLAVAAQEGIQVKCQGAKPTCSRWSFENGKAVLGQYDGLSFYRYDNATKKMSRCNTPGFDVEYLNKSYALPRTGKDITVTTWDKNGKKTQKTLKWNGHGFSY